MKIGIVLTHNKTDQENIDQINTLKSLMTEVEDTFDEFDEEGKVIGQFTTTHHEIIGLGRPHEVKVYQIVPYGVTPPPNRYEVNSGGLVEYGVGDEDKTGDHPRFFNWGLKRGTDNGAEVVVHIENVAKFSVADLAAQLNTIIDPTDKTEYIEDAGTKLASLTMLKEVGQLDETKSKEDAISELKEKINTKGLEASEVTIG